jgi:hypothetical protein
LRYLRYEILVLTDQDEDEVSRALAHATEGLIEDLEPAEVYLIPQGEGDAHKLAHPDKEGTP